MADRALDALSAAGIVEAAIPMDFETFAAQRGGSRQDIGNAGAHRRSTRQSDKQWKRIVKALDAKTQAVVQKRADLRQEYDRLVQDGVLRPLTAKEQLEQTAAGHADNPSVQAARRLLVKRHGYKPDHWAASEALAEGTLDKPHKCGYCEAPASKALVRADGRAFIPVCDKDASKGRDRIVKTNKDSVTKVVPLPTKKDEATKDRRRQDAITYIAGQVKVAPTLDSVNRVISRVLDTAERTKQWGPSATYIHDLGDDTPELESFRRAVLREMKAHPHLYEGSFALGYSPGHVGRDEFLRDPFLALYGEYQQSGPDTFSKASGHQPRAGTVGKSYPTDVPISKHVDVALGADGGMAQEASAAGTGGPGADMRDPSLSHDPDAEEIAQQERPAPDVTGVYPVPANLWALLTLVRRNGQALARTTAGELVPVRPVKDLTHRQSVYAAQFFRLKEDVYEAYLDGTPRLLTPFGIAALAEAVVPDDLDGWLDTFFMRVTEADTTMLQQQPTASTAQTMVGLAGVVNRCGNDGVCHYHPDTGHATMTLPAARQTTGVSTALMRQILAVPGVKSAQVRFSGDADDSPIPRGHQGGPVDMGYRTRTRDLPPILPANSQDDVPVRLGAWVAGYDESLGYELRPALDDATVLNPVDHLAMERYAQRLAQALTTGDRAALQQWLARGGGFPVSEASDLTALRLMTVSHAGKRFETGKPVSFEFLRNTESSPNLGSRFGQDIEPAGRYMIQKEPSAKPMPGWEHGSVSFKNPLVLAWVGYGPDGWKARLSKHYGGKKGKALSQAVRKAGYDGIVTVTKMAGQWQTGEIVDLTNLREDADLDEAATPAAVKSYAQKAKYQILDLGTHGRFAAYSVRSLSANSSKLVKQRHKDPAAFLGKVHSTADYAKGRTGDKTFVADPIVDDFDIPFFLKRVSKAMDTLHLPKTPGIVIFTDGKASGWMYPHEAKAHGGLTPIRINRAPSGKAQEKYGDWKGPRSPHTLVHEYAHQVWFVAMSKAQRRAVEDFFKKHVAGKKKAEALKTKVAPTEYSTTKASEWWAEIVGYSMHPGRLNPLVIEFIKKVMQGATVPEPAPMLKAECVYAPDAPDLVTIPLEELADLCEAKVTMPDLEKYLVPRKSVVIGGKWWTVTQRDLKAGIVKMKLADWESGSGTRVVKISSILTNVNNGKWGMSILNKGHIGKDSPRFGAREKRKKEKEAAEKKAKQESCILRAWIPATTPDDLDVKLAVIGEFARGWGGASPVADGVWTWWGEVEPREVSHVQTAVEAVGGINLTLVPPIAVFIPEAIHRDNPFAPESSEAYLYHVLMQALRKGEVEPTRGAMQQWVQSQREATLPMPHLAAGPTVITQLAKERVIEHALAEALLGLFAVGTAFTSGGHTFQPGDRVRVTQHADGKVTLHHTTLTTDKGTLTISDTEWGAWQTDGRITARADRRASPNPRLRRQLADLEPPTSSQQSAPPMAGSGGLAPGTTEKRLREGASSL